MADPDAVTRILKDSLAEQEDEASAVMVSQSILRAYLRKELPAELEAQVDAALARSSATRRRLQTLSAEFEPRRLSKSQAWLGFPVAAAAVLAVGLFAFEPEPLQLLPKYAPNGPTGFLKSVRGETQAETERRLDSASIFEVLLRPRTTPKGPVFARVYAQALHSPLRGLPEASVTIDRGVVKVALSGLALFGMEPGSKRITIAVAPSQDMLESLEGRLHGTLAQSESAGLQWWSYVVEYAPEAG
ncbi:MAG: hypothetical protein AAGJ19_08725 [Myxococcota bacterium]